MKHIFSNRTYMGLNPASVDLDTGLITINRDVWVKLSSVQKKLILFHEQAHVVLDTVDDEIACDRWAIERFAGTQKKSLRKTVEAYRELLDKDYISEERKISILKACLQIDAERFGNERAKHLLAEIERNTSDKRVANEIVAIVSAAVALVGLAQQTILGARAQWFKGNDSKKTGYRMGVLEACTQMVVHNWAETYRHLGINELKKRVADRGLLHSSVYQYMHTKGILEDRNIFNNRKANNESVFFKSNNYGWARDEINKFADKFLLVEIEDLKANGYGDNPTSESKSKINWWFYGILGIIGIVLIKKLLR